MPLDIAFAIAFATCQNIKYKHFMDKRSRNRRNARLIREYRRMVEKGRPVMEVKKRLAERYGLDITTVYRINRSAMEESKKKTI